MLQRLRQFARELREALSPLPPWFVWAWAILWPLIGGYDTISGQIFPESLPSIREMFRMTGGELLPLWMWVAGGSVIVWCALIGHVCAVKSQGGRNNSPSQINDISIGEAYHYIDTESALARDPLKKGQCWPRNLLDDALRDGHIDATGIRILNDTNTLDSVFAAPGPPLLSLAGNRVPIRKEEWERMQVPASTDIMKRTATRDHPHATRPRGIEQRAVCYAYVCVNMRQVEGLWPRPNVPLAPRPNEPAGPVERNAWLLHALHFKATGQWPNPEADPFPKLPDEDGLDWQLRVNESEKIENLAGQLVWFRQMLVDGEILAWGQPDPRRLLGLDGPIEQGVWLKIPKKHWKEFRVDPEFLIYEPSGCCTTRGRDGIDNEAYCALMVNREQVERVIASASRAGMIA